MRYPEEVVEEVRTKNDIVSIIGQYVKLKRSGANYVGLCPFHNEKTPSFSVSPSKQMYYCFGCHKGGTVFHFLMDFENMTFQEAVDLAGELLPGVVIPGHWDLFAHNSADPAEFADYLDAKYPGAVTCVLPEYLETITIEK